MNRMTVEIEGDGVVVRTSVTGPYNPDIGHDLVARSLEAFEGALAAFPFHSVDDSDEDELDEENLEDAESEDES